MEADRDRKNNLNVPKELKKRWKRATNREKNSLFALWVQAEKDWESVLLLEQVVRESRAQGSVKESWLTRKQILQHYEYDEVFTDALTSKKETDGKTRPHPMGKQDRVKSAKQFLICSDCSIIRTEIRIIRRTATLSVEVDKLHQENDELKNALQHNIRAVRHLETETANVGKDIRTTEMSQQYQEFEEEEHEES